MAGVVSNGKHIAGKGFDPLALQQGPEIHIQKPIGNVVRLANTTTACSSPEGFEKAPPLSPEFRLENSLPIHCGLESGFRLAG